MKLPHTITVDTSILNDPAQRRTFTVRYTAPLRFRLWLGVKLLHAAAWCFGADLDAQLAEDGTP